MPRGIHPNSLANLSKGHKFSSNDGSAVKAGKKSRETQMQTYTMSEQFKAIVSPEKRAELARELLRNMPKSTQWFELGLKMLGELPKEEIEVNFNDRAAAIDELEKIVIEDHRPKN